MFKKIVLVLFCLVFVASFAFAKDQLQTKKKVDISSKRIGYITPDGKNVQIDKLPSPFSTLGVKQSSSLSDAQPYRGKKLDNGYPATEGFEDLITYFDWPPAAGFIFGPNDSVAVWFRPVTQCSLLSVFVYWNDDAVGNEYTMQIKKVADQVNGVYDFSKGTEGDFEPMSEFDQDWLGRTLGSYTYTVASAAAVEFPITAFGLAPEDLDMGVDDFAVLWHFPAATDPNGAELWGDLPTAFNHHGFKYYTGGHASLGGQPGWVARYNFSIWAKVLYYGDPPPSVDETNDIADQYNSIDPGPYHVEATVSDLGSDVFTGYLRRVAIIMDDDNNPFNAPNDTTWLYDEAEGTDTEVTVTYDIANPGIGNSVYYWYHVEDNGAENEADPEAFTHTTQSTVMHFTVREKNPDATILLVDDSFNQGLSAQYTDALDALGYVYDFWDTFDGDTTSLDILNLYQTLIWYEGTGQAFTAADVSSTQLAPYLDNGGQLFFNGSDFVGVVENFDDPDWIAWTTPTDDFILNYLKVDQILDDANVISRDGTDMSGDTLYTGLEGTITETAIVDTFEADMLNFGYNNWSGQVEPNPDAETIMQVFDAGFEDWNETAGLAYDGEDFKVIYLPWCFEGIIEPEARMMLLNIFLGDFFGENAAPVFSNFKGSRHGVPALSGPFAVSVDVEDSDGSVATVELGYAIDGGEYTWVPMSMGDSWDGEIPQLTAEDTTVAYTVRATDDQDKTRYHDQIFTFHQTDFVVENTALLYCGDDPYDWYYGGNVDSLVTQTLNDLEVVYDYWDADQNGPPDYYTVLSNYASAIWHGYADWYPETFPVYTADNPFYNFIMGGGNFLFSSEEMLGTWWDWEDHDIVPGETAYDVLNVSWYGPDFAFDTTRVFSTTEEPLTVGMDSIQSLVELPFGYMGDLADPVNMDAYIFDAWLGDFGIWYGDMGYGASWRYQDPEYGYKHVMMPFCLANLDSANRAAFLDNVITWFETPTVGIDKGEIASVPKAYSLKQNFPNPFNPVTEIHFDLPKTADVKLSVYNVVGQKIRTILDHQMKAGRHMAKWDGKNESGARVATGIYIYRIETPEFIASKKMVLMK